MMYTTIPATAAAAAALAAPEPQPGTGSCGKPGNCAKQLLDQTAAARMTETMWGDRAFIGGSRTLPRPWFGWQDYFLRRR